jgi:RNA polymerase sigma-70 factor (ECF subfamily)
MARRMLPVEITGESGMQGFHFLEDRTAETKIATADSQQLSEVAARYSGMFYRHAYRYLRNEEDAHDIVQEALLLAHRHLSQFKGNAQLSTWVMSIVINSARRHFRRRSLHSLVSIDVAAENQEAIAFDSKDPGPNPEESYADEEFRNRLLEAVARLPTSLQKVYRMRDLEGKTTAEVAGLLGLNEGTVKAYLFRARSKLGRSLLHTGQLQAKKIRVAARSDKRALQPCREANEKPYDEKTCV